MTASTNLSRVARESQKQQQVIGGFAKQLAGAFKVHEMVDAAAKEILAASNISEAIQQASNHITSPSVDMMMELGAQAISLQDIIKDFGETVGVQSTGNFADDFHQITGLDVEEITPVEFISEGRNNLQYQQNQDYVVPSSDGINLQTVMALLDSQNKTIENLRKELDDLKNKSILRKDKKVSQKPNLSTREKIRHLANYRQEQISKKKSIPGWVASCQWVGIDPKTANNHASNLRAQWENKDYEWSEDKEFWEK
jgi:hypothetical protein